MEGFEVFMESLKREVSLRSRQKSGVDLVLSCVDNYEARMVVNQVGCLFFEHGFPYNFKKLCENQLLFIFNSKFSTAILIRDFFFIVQACNELGQTWMESGKLSSPFFRFKILASSFFIC